MERINTWKWIILIPEIFMIIGLLKQDEWIAIGSICLMLIMLYNFVFKFVEDLIEVLKK